MIHMVYFHFVVDLEVNIDELYYYKILEIYLLRTKKI